MLNEGCELFSVILTQNNDIKNQFKKILFIFGTTGIPGGLVVTLYIT